MMLPPHRMAEPMHPTHCSYSTYLQIKMHCEQGACGSSARAGDVCTVADTVAVVREACNVSRS